MILTYKVFHQTLTKDNTNAVISDSQKYLSIAFNFSDDWQGMTKYVQFKRDDKFYEILLGEDNKALVPWEILVDAGKIIISLFGNNDDGVFIATNSVTLTVEGSGLVKDAESLAPTENSATQLLASVTEKANIATEKAGVAIEKANLATEKANLAVTKANEAAASANSASQAVSDIADSVETVQNIAEAVNNSVTGFAARDKRINVLDYGVAADGTNHTAQFTAAIRDAIMQRRPLYIPAGKYIGTLTVDLDSIYNGPSDVQRDIYIDIYGDGMATIIQGPENSTVLTVKGALKDEYKANTSLRMTRFFKIHDMQLVGTSTSVRAGTGLLLQYVQNVDVYNLEVRYCLKGIDITGGMDCNFHNINILDVGSNSTMTGADYALTIQKYVNATSHIDRSSNALKFNNIRIENYSKILHIGDSCYAVYFNNFKFESGRTFSGSNEYPITIDKAKKVYFSNGHCVYSNSHDPENDSYIQNPISVVSGYVPYIYVSDYTADKYNFASGDRIGFTQVDFGCPPGYKAQFVNVCRTVFNSCVFNSLDCSSGTNPGIRLRGDSIMTNCYINNSSGSYDIVKTGTDIISRVIGSARTILDSTNTEYSVPCYKTVNELGLTKPCTTINIINAMPNNSTAVITVGQKTTDVTDVPTAYGVLTIRRGETFQRTDIEYKESVGAGSARRYFASYNSNAGTIAWYLYTVTSV